MLKESEALELIECLWLKFNEIVYLRNAHSAKYFAGFPIGFNICVGGQDQNGNDFSNELSHMFLKAQEDIGLPQPNLSVRLHEHTNDELLNMRFELFLREVECHNFSMIRQLLRRWKIWVYRILMPWIMRLWVVWNLQHKAII